MIGFTFNGLHVYNDYGVIVTGLSRPMLPELRRNELTIPGRHGTYDFSNNTYELRQISVDIAYQATSLTDLQAKARALALWLAQTTYLHLIFDDEPDKYYLAKIYSSVGLNQLSQYGQATILFDCQPYALAVDPLDLTNYI